MSDIDTLKMRYKNSPAMFENMKQQEDSGESTPEQPPESKTAETMRFIRNHPDIKKLKSVSADSGNSEKIKEQVKKVRLFMLKELAASKDHDLTGEELVWAGEVLGIRIDRAQSVKDLQQNLEYDCIQDLDRLIMDVQRVRSGVERTEVLSDRYPSLAHFARVPSAEEYTGTPPEPGSEVPDIDMDAG